MWTVSDSLIVNRDISSKIQELSRPKEIGYFMKEEISVPARATLISDHFLGFIVIVERAFLFFDRPIIVSIYS